MNAGHQSVLLEESLAGLNLRKDGIYVDGTFGRGGHSSAILNQLGEHGQLIAIDKDAAAIEHANNIFKNDKRFRIVKSSFAQIKDIANQLEIAGQIDGILLDLGVSSPQLDDPERGFSFMHKGPLDMRMDAHQAMDAATFINHASAQEMATVFKQYGEERFSKRIATAIVNERSKAPITTTERLAEIVKAANPKWEKHKHPATRVFQAIRIHINQELVDLELFLQHSLDVLKIGGRLAIISFHSLEDRIVKQFMRDKERGNRPPPGIPIKESEIERPFKRIGKAIKPSALEINNNIRARSAVLRIGERVT